MGNMPVLPSKPDRQTGKPAPPEAPAFYGNAKKRRTAERHKPAPPHSDMGPTIAWYRTSGRSNVVGFFVTLVIFAFIISVITVAQGGGFFEWLQAWQVWLAVVLGSALIASPLRIQYQAAGADWFAWGQQRLYAWWRPQKWRVLYTYEITEITADAHGATGIFLTFTDLRGNEFTKPRSGLQLDQRIWDLAYNGILHSLANGASVDKLSQQVLEIPESAKRAKAQNWLDRKPLPNWPSDSPIPDPDDY